MNVWVRLAPPLDAGDVLTRAQNQGVAFLPGRYFEVARRDPGALRLSFAGLTTGEIQRGLEILGRVIAGEWERVSEHREPAPAMV